MTTLDFTAALWRESGSAELKSVRVGPLVRDLVIAWIRENRLLDGEPRGNHLP